MYKIKDIGADIEHEFRVGCSTQSNLIFITEINDRSTKLGQDALTTVYERSKSL